MKTNLIITTFSLGIIVTLNGLEAFAQGPNTNANPPTQVIQAQNMNYNPIINPVENLPETIVINDDNIQMDIERQQASPSAPLQQEGGLASLFGTSTGTAEPCTDCDKVKKAIKLSHASSGGGQHKRSFSMKKWSKKVSGKMNMKMRKTFSRKHKVKSNYAICFNWK